MICSLPPFKGPKHCAAGREKSNVLSLFGCEDGGLLCILTLESLFMVDPEDHGSLYALIGESSKLQRIIFFDNHLAAGIISGLKSRSGVPDIRRVDSNALNEWVLDWYGNQPDAGHCVEEVTYW